MSSDTSTVNPIDTFQFLFQDSDAAQMTQQQRYFREGLGEKSMKFSLKLAVTLWC
jgi:hypothetical protein